MTTTPSFSRRLYLQEGEAVFCVDADLFFAHTKTDVTAEVDTSHLDV